MKKVFCVQYSVFSLALAGLLAICQPAAAQVEATSSNGIITITGTTTNSVTTIPNFFTTAMAWATVIDTNYTWAGVGLQFEDGYAQETGLGAADYVRAQYNFGRWNVALEGQFFGVGSSFNGFLAGGGYAIVQKGDLKIEVNGLLGEQKVSGSRAFAALGEVKLTKFMTKLTYMTIGLGVPYVQNQTFDGTPVFRTGFGFIF
jgi:hypothetical protein